jgi:hypothetical protein
MNFDASIDLIDAIMPPFDGRAVDEDAVERVRASVERMPGAG